MVNTNTPWVNGMRTALLVRHPFDYFINLAIDDSGHMWLTVDFGQSWVDLNLPSVSNLLAVSGHTSVDTFATGAAIFVGVLVGGVYPLIVGTRYGAFVTFTQPTAKSGFVFAR
jgi:hypothetical protein